jgi:response regulator NasT
VLAPDLVITDIKMPEMDGIEAAAEVNREREVPVILLSAYHEEDLLQRAGADFVTGYLVKPVSQAGVEAAINVGLQRWARFRQVRQDAAAARQALEERKLIERAKGVVMRRLGGLDEQEAFRRMRTFASNHNHKLTEVARRVLEAEQLFASLEDV